ncbi:MAG: hypothetical protein A3F11_03075 [Gammaproteobacteria bacterium RIFCSPHIGHO2_12_FULL_37_14]|nr:MAG: hypothetical protein A3F11_03075 [Gammaproteobacteria bacterium RIFCSPHIGHO2_12_FULL_37_14]
MSVTEKTRTFLAVTALEEFWDISQPMLFLGDWCVSHAKKATIENLDTEVLRSPFSDGDKDAAYDYIACVSEKLLSNIAIWLNQIHGTNHTLRYWRIVLEPFLLHYVIIVYNRFCYLKKAYALYPDISTIGLALTSYVTPRNTAEFEYFAAESDHWNLQLFTQLSSIYFKEPISYKSHMGDIDVRRQKEIFSKNSFPKKTIKQKIIQWYVRWRGRSIVDIFNYHHGFIQSNTYLLFLWSKFRILPVIPPVNALVAPWIKMEFDLSAREQIAKLPAEDNFSRLVLETLKINMPVNMIETYHAEVKNCEKRFPYHPGVIVVAAWLGDDLLQFWAANEVENGALLVTVQHGGGTDFDKFCLDGLDSKLSDKHISWGWKYEGNVVPASSTRISSSEMKLKRKLQKTEKNKILWVTTRFSTYSSYRECFTGHAQQVYADGQIQFYEALRAGFLQQIEMRLYPGSPHYYYYKKNFPGLNVSLPNHHSSFFDQLCSARIFIGDNANTTFTYAMAFNIPTILFWNKILWKVPKMAEPCFNVLRQVGIFYDSPKPAAKMLNKIVDDPWAWWYSEPVQSARKSYCESFARTSPGWLKEWRNLLLGFSNNREKIVLDRDVAV